VTLLRCAVCQLARHRACQVLMVPRGGRLPELQVGWPKHVTEHADRTLRSYISPLWWESAPHISATHIEGFQDRIQEKRPCAAGAINILTGISNKPTVLRKSLVLTCYNLGLRAARAGSRCDWPTENTDPLRQDQAIRGRVCSPTY
jgi:hypothetical protein